MPSEIKIRFDGPLTHASLVDPDAPLPAAVSAQSQYTDTTGQVARQLSAEEPDTGNVPESSYQEADELPAEAGQSPADEPGPTPNELALQSEVDSLRVELQDVAAQLEAQQQKREDLESELAEMAAVKEAEAAEESSAEEPAVPEDDQQSVEEFQAQEEELNAQKELIEQSVRSMSEAAGALQEDFRLSLEKMQGATTNLALAIASRLLRETIDADRFPVEALVRELLKRLESADFVTVRLHPDDLALLKQRVGEADSLFEDKAGIEFIPDESLSRGDCEATTGEVDVFSRLDDQLAEIRQHMTVSE